METTEHAPMQSCRTALERRLLSLPDEAVTSSTLALWLEWHLATPDAATRHDMANRCRLHIEAFEVRGEAAP